MTDLYPCITVDRRYLILDFETQSELDVTRVGAFEYARHPSTRIMCVAWQMVTHAERVAKRLLPGTPDVAVWRPERPSPHRSLISGLLDPKVILVAHNAGFEQMIVRYVMTRRFTDPREYDVLRAIPINRWICTASLARAMSLPGKLEGVCGALKLPHQKDTEGHRLMLKHTKPRKPTANNPELWHHGENHETERERIALYCARDIHAERDVLFNVPDLTPKEREVWLLDQQINQRGVPIDRPLVKQAITLLNQETRYLDREIKTLTKGRVTTANQLDKLKLMLKRLGCELPDLTAKTIKDQLKRKDVEGKVRRLLEIRQAASKASVKKYPAFLNRTEFDSTLRDILIYCGAGTGRFTGVGLQIHNLPRRGFKGREFDLALAALKSGDLEWCRLLFGDPIEMLVCLIRPMILAGEGFELFAGDWNAIEARVLVWLAGDEPALRIYRAQEGETDKLKLMGLDPYRRFACSIYDKESVLDIEDDERQMGKRAELGAGFGIGWKKFMLTCEQYDQPISAAFAKRVIKTYRERHQAVVQTWYATEKAAIKTVQTGKPHRVHDCAPELIRKKYPNLGTLISFEMRGDYLALILPSGRALYYYKPIIRYEMTPWEEKRPKLYHWDIHPKTKRWVLSGTYGGKIVENFVQATAREFMVRGMLRVEKAGYQNLFTVHDEVAARKKTGEGDLAEYLTLLSKKPKWGESCPLKVEGFQSDRYRK